MPHYQWCDWWDFEQSWSRSEIKGALAIRRIFSLMNMITKPKRGFSQWLGCCDIIQILTSECRKHGRSLKYIKLVFDVTQKCAKWPLTNNHHFICTIYKTVGFQNRTYFGILMLAFSTWLLVLLVTGGFWLTGLVMWYKCMWLESGRKSRKVQKSYEIGYNSSMNPVQIQRIMENTVLFCIQNSNFSNLWITWWIPLLI